MLKYSPPVHACVETRHLRPRGRVAAASDSERRARGDGHPRDDEEYIARQVGRMITVSVETVKLVRALPELLIALEAE